MDQLTLKQETACLAFIETGNKSEAYRQAFNAENMKPATINRRAKDLFDLGKIKARVEELQDKAVKRNEITVDDLVKELEEARIMASGGERPQATAMVSATLGKAKLLGLIVDKNETEHKGGVTITASPLDETI